MTDKETPELLTPRQVAKLLQTAVGTLAIWRCKKRYPLLHFVKIGRLVRYRRADVNAFIAKRTV